MGIFSNSAKSPVELPLELPLELALQSWPDRTRRRSWEKIPRGFTLLLAPMLLAPMHFACLLFAALLFALLGALAGCTSNDSGQLLIDPGRYDVYKCEDLAARWKVVSAREKELRGLMEKADQSSGGAVVGSLAYRVDYDAVISDEKLLQRTAADRKCALPVQSGQPQNTLYQSDQSIR